MGFGDILVIFRFWGYFGHFMVSGSFGHFLDFDGILVIFRFWGYFSHFLGFGDILVIF